MNPFTSFDRRLPDDLRTAEQIEQDSIPTVKSDYEYDAEKWEKVTDARLTNRSEK